MCEEIIKRLEKLSEPKFAQWLMPFLSITKESGEVVLGVRVPKLRKLANEYKNIELSYVQSLLESNIHEAKALAVFIMLKKLRNICDEKNTILHWGRCEKYFC